MACVIWVALDLKAAYTSSLRPHTLVDRYLKDVACVIWVALDLSYSYYQHGPR